VLQAGLSVINITPYVRCEMCGYANRPDRSRGVHDKLLAKVLVLADGETQLAVVSCDLVGLEMDTIASIRERISREVGMPGEQVMIACTHTHSGPTLGTLRGMGEVDPSLLETTEKKIAGAVYEACTRLVQARVGFGMGEVQIGINRRARQPDGSIALAENAAGAVDREVGVMRIDDEQGCPLAIFFNHPCHAVVMGGDNVLISSDYPGYARCTVEQVMGDGVSAIFINGCAGNINPRMRGTFAHAERLGAMLGSEAVKVAQLIETSDQISLDCTRELIEIPLRPLPSVSELERTLTDFEGQIAAQPPERNWREYTVLTAQRDWARDSLALLARGTTSLSSPFEVQVMRIGPAALVGLSAEVFVEIGQAIKQRSSLSPTFVAGFANGVIGYLPTASAHLEGGYEVDNAPRYYGYTAPAPEAEAIVVDAAVRLLKADI